jgi:hypothetical protein
MASVVVLSPLLCTQVGNARSPADPQFPLSLSGDGRHVVDRTNTPFFINGEAAWSLIASLSQADAEIYLEDRRRKGFNLVLVNLLEHRFSSHAPANFYGHSPFTTPGDFSTPSEEYFAHADWVIETARKKGLAVLLAPLYLGWACTDDGWCQEVKTNSLETMRKYGDYVGTRYRNQSNIIWLIGGDVDPFGGHSERPLKTTLRRVIGPLLGESAPDDVSEKVRAFVSGLKAADREHLVSAHNAPEQSAMEPWPTDTWLDLNNVYTYGDAYVKSLRELHRTPFKPFFLVETFYENSPESTELGLRRQAYSAVLSGATLGHIFGNCQVWAFSWKGGVGGACPEPWKSQLDSVGSKTVALAGRLFRSRAFDKLEPDWAHRVLTVGYQNGNTYAAVARTSDGTTVIAYLPTRRLVTVNLSTLSGDFANAWWFNPRTGEASLIETVRSLGYRNFLPPDTDDWILVVDDAAAHLTAPGLQ